MTNNSLSDAPAARQRSAWFDAIRRPSFFFAIALALLTINVRRGPDYDFYLDWSRAAVDGDVFRIHSPVESPTGLPLSQWCAGPGLAAAPLVALCETCEPAEQPQTAESLFYILIPPIVDEHGVLLTAALFSVVFWCGLGKLLTIVTDGRHALTIFGLAAAFVGTHLGYYSVACGAELLSLAPIALLAIELARPMKSRLGGIVLVGGCTAMLIMLRPYLVLYALPTLVATVLRMWPGQSIGRRAAGGLALAGLVGLGIGQVAIVNSWMTGDWTHSPYVFGDGEFRSFDFLSPEFAAVLFHPLHGWLVYHPLCLVGLAAISALVLRAPERSERCVWLAMLIVIGLHVWFQAAWYQWWLATTATFGMRGLAAAGIPCIAAIARLLRMWQDQGASRRGWIRALTIVIAMTGVWSWLLMTRGATDYYSYRELLGGHWQAIRNLVSSSQLVTLGFAAVISVVALGPVVLARRESTDREAREPALATLLLAALAMAFLVAGWIDNRILSVQYGVIAAGCVLAMVLYHWRYRVAWTPRPLPRGASVASLVFLALMLAWFVHLAVPTQRHLLADSAPPNSSQSRIRWRADFFVTETKLGYQDYLKISGFETKKERLRRFLVPFDVPDVVPADQRGR